MLDLIWRGIAMGVGGTVFMDIWAIVLHRFFGQSAPNWGAGRPLVLASAEGPDIPRYYSDGRTLRA